MSQIILSAVEGLPEAESRRQSERLGVKHLLGVLLGGDVVVTHDGDGAPSIDGHRELNLSVTHSRDVAVVALSRDVRVGVDVEFPSERLERVIGRVSQPQEVGLDPLRLWTAKEAVFKCAAISNLTIGEVCVDARYESATVRGQCFWLHFTEAYGACVALAVAEPE